MRAPCSVAWTLPRLQDDPVDERADGLRGIEPGFGVFKGLR